jgi:hypothetical protein
LRIVYSQTIVAYLSQKAGVGKAFAEFFDLPLVVTLLARAMNNYYVAQGGGDIFNMIRDQVYEPLKLSAGTLMTVRTDNSPTGVPFGGYGLFWTQDDIAKVAMLLNNQNGVINGSQALNSDLLADSMQDDPSDRGMNTTGTPVFKYNNAFWAKEMTPSEFPQYTCSFWVPFMSGYGGITVAMAPNGATYSFSDNEEYSWYNAINETNKLSPICP